jgi:hypothetical protein
MGYILGKRAFIEIPRGLFENELGMRSGNIVYDI